MEIVGNNTILFKSKGGDNMAFHDMYHIPRLWSNILSVGQLDENDCKIDIDANVLRMRDHDNHELLTKVQHMPDLLYILWLTLAILVCLVASYDVDEQWHTRFGHLGFQTLQNMA